jgi:hypothetical protein
VTTADGKEYEFRGVLEKWQDRLARALTARGRQIYTVPDGIAVTPRITPE